MQWWVTLRRRSLREFDNANPPYGLRRLIKSCFVYRDCPKKRFSRD